MTCSSSLTDDLTPLIVDTSVVINLHACSLGEQILSAIPNSVLVPHIVIQELSHERSQLNGEHQFLKSLLTRKIVRPVSLDDADWTKFKQLTTNPPILGYGEAATVVVAASNSYLPVIDDGKGRKRAKELIGESEIAWSLDLFLHPNVQERLEDNGYIEAIHLALRNGRMRIDEERCDAIVELIGEKRALQCPCLPRFRARSELWKRTPPQNPP